MRTDAPWWVIVPVKDTRRAKTRLGEAFGDRRRLAITMARRTLAAAVGAPNVAEVHVVCQDVDDANSLVQPGVRFQVEPHLGLNEAIRAGAAMIRSTYKNRRLAVILADLPYLHAYELAEALEMAAGHSSACVADRSGLGTTMLTARGGIVLAPAFGASSLMRHVADGAVLLDILVTSGLRHDVDFPEDFRIPPDNDFDWSEYPGTSAV